MVPAIGVVADDLTGAADTGVAFLASARSTIVTWPEFMSGCEVDGAEALAIDTGSRAMGPDRAIAVTAKVVAQLRDGGVRTLYKKIDSLLRGHIGEEVSAAIGAWHGDALAVVAPAFPSTGRTTIRGRQYSNGAAVDAATVPDILRLARLPTETATLNTVRDGRLDVVLKDGARRRCRAIVCDAETDDDLGLIARAGTGLESVVWVGSGGLARAVAVELASGRAPTRPQPRHADGPILTVVGSRSAIARAQVASAVAEGSPHVRMPLRALTAESDDEAQDFLRQLDLHLASGLDVVVTISDALGEPDGDDPHLAMRLGSLLRPFAPRVGGLILTGGDTAVGVLHAWGMTALALVEEIDPGVVLSETVSARPLPIVTKSGSFGGSDALIRARRRLRGALGGV
jgi:4-hydroxythreonine-4-phosphate dehydrogenase